MSFLAALQLLTSIPIPLKRELSPAQLGRATAYFPLTGIIIGGILAGLNWLLCLILPASVTNILLIVALVIITGALHLDGLADTCDGMAGHRTVEERWKVMHDSHTGAFGVVGIVLILLAKYVSLNSIPADYMTAILLFTPVASRWAMVYAMFAFRYARPEGLGKAYKAATRRPQFTIATVFALAIAAALYPLFSFTGFIIIAGIWVIATMMGFYFRYKFAGQTGDTYGATNEVAEVMVLVLTVIVAECTTLL